MEVFVPPQTDSVPPSPLTPQSPADVGDAASSDTSRPAFNRSTMFGDSGDDSGSESGAKQNESGEEKAKVTDDGKRPEVLSSLPPRQRLMSNSSSSPANLGRLESGSDPSNAATSVTSTCGGNGDEAEDYDTVGLYFCVSRCVN